MSFDLQSRGRRMRCYTYSLLTKQRCWWCSWCWLILC